MKEGQGVQLLTTRQVAAKLGVHHKLVIRWIKNLSLPCYRFAKEYRFVEAEIDSWIEQHRHRSAFDAKRLVESRKMHTKN